MQHNATLAKEGGFICLLEEALPTNTTSTQIFANAPAGVSHIELTVRAHTLTIRFSGGAATAGGNGQDYGVGGPYTLTMNQVAALLCHGIGTSASATGWISYWGQGY